MSTHLGYKGICLTVSLMSLARLILKVEASRVSTVLSTTSGAGLGWMMGRMVMILGFSTAAAAVNLGLTTLVALFFVSYAFLAALAAASLFFLS